MVESTTDASRIRALPHRKGKRGKTCIQLDRALDTGRYLCKHSELLIGADFGKTAQAAFNEAVIAELFRMVSIASTGRITNSLRNRSRLFSSNPLRYSGKEEKDAAQSKTDGYSSMFSFV